MLLKDKIVVISGIGPGLGVKLAVEAAREGRAAWSSRRAPSKSSTTPKRESMHSASTATC